MIDNLYDLLRACTARIHAADALGTGFFVAPGKLLTCGHVIKNTHLDPKNIIIHYNQQDFPLVQILKYLPAPYPDLALLQIAFKDHPFVYWDQRVEPRDPLYAYGFSKKFSSGEPMTLEAVGLEQTSDGKPFLRLKDEVIQPGASGSPVLNERTQGVCGMIKYSRSEELELGGGAIPVSTIFKELPELAEANKIYTSYQNLWNELLNKHQDLQPPVRSVDVRLYWQAASVRRPSVFLGRQDLLDNIPHRLKDKHRVLLVGMGGSGKTAIAAMLAYHWLQENPAPVLWLHAGNADFETILECICQQVAADPQFQDLDTEVFSLGELLDLLKPSLLVIDDAWNGSTLSGFLSDIPPNLPLLVTSRQGFPKFQRMEVGDLSREDAIAVLGAYAGWKDYQSDPDANRLCKALSYHAYALEIAGANLDVDEFLTPAILLNEIAKKPHESEMPAGMAEPGRENVGRLIQFSLEHMRPAEQAAFSLFGALFAPSATTALLAACMNLEAPVIKPALEELARHSLIRQEQPDYFDMHDLAFSFAQSQFPPSGDRQQAILDSIVAYLAANAQNNDLLALDMENLLQAAKIANPVQRLQIMAYIVLGGYPLPAGQGYFDERGHTSTMLMCLEQTVADTRHMGGDVGPTLHYLLCKLGNAYFDCKDIQNGLAAYQDALDFAPNINRKIKVTAGVGLGLNQKGERKRADQFLKGAQELALQQGDDNALAFVFQYRSHVANQRGHTVSSRNFAAQAVKINRRTKDDLGLAFSLLNLGSTETDLGHMNKAQNYLQEALIVSRWIDRLDLIADVLHALGDCYHALQDRDQAGKYYQEAIELSHDSGDQSHEEELREFMQANSYLTLSLSGKEMEDEN